ncbi:hypothetical protein [Paracoccus sp. S3-43]|uniref:hypothetical protein n=1 Tax=Paracoccus sp. S3-43 TaxID=3030011 RepID=UPI0023B0E71A|nr:hypothetical protein [Paracoccus sp. S3-43]WEF23271.1 hypothetical protein PXD02_10585 [Paracoccus sp. S3-43]
MKIKTFTAPLALAAMLGSTAFAQTMVGDQEVSDADLPAVTQHCQTLATGSTTATSDPADGNADDDSDATPPANAGTMDGAQPTTGTEGNVDDDSPDPATAATAGTPVDSTTGNDGNQDADEFSGSINLDLITLADCQAAGL